MQASHQPLLFPTASHHRTVLAAFQTLQLGLQSAAVAHQADQETRSEPPKVPVWRPEVGSTTVAVRYAPSSGHAADEVVPV